MTVFFIFSNLFGTLVCCIYFKSCILRRSIVIFGANFLDCSSTEAPLGLVIPNDKKFALGSLLNLSKNTSVLSPDVFGLSIHTISRFQCHAYLQKVPVRKEMNCNSDETYLIISWDSEGLNLTK